ncbi:hypothetical protein [Bradyrhizobium liaoningense]
MWKDPIRSTPSIIQTDFGPFGQSLPGDGEAYCGPTSMVMGLYFSYQPGSFNTVFDNWVVSLQWKPAASPQSLPERWRANARARSR